MKVVILGSTGMVGKGVLLECLEDSRIEKVLLINRQSCQVSNEKITEVLHSDFLNMSNLSASLAGFDACFFCMGITSAGMDEKGYSKITYELTRQFAEIFIRANPDSIFCYVSGAGTDSSEKGRIMWARVKGKTENTILAMPFKKAFMFRPGYIHPMKGVKSKTGWYNMFYVVLKPLYFLLKPAKAYVTDSATLGKAMINTAINGYDKNIIESVDINILGRSK